MPRSITLPVFHWSNIKIAKTTIATTGPAVESDRLMNITEVYKILTTNTYSVHAKVLESQVPNPCQHNSFWDYSSGGSKTTKLHNHWCQTTLNIPQDLCC